MTPENDEKIERLEDPAVALCYEGGTVFNPVQQHLLRMFAFDGSEERLNEVKKVLTKYYSEQLDKELNDLWDSGVISQEKLDELWGVDVRKV